MDPMGTKVCYRVFWYLILHPSLLGGSSHAGLEVLQIEGLAVRSSRNSSLECCWPLQWFPGRRTGAVRNHCGWVMWCSPPKAMWLCLKMRWLRPMISYHLVVTNSSPWYRWPIEIDGLQNLKNGGSFHGYVTNNQRLLQFFIILPIFQ